MPVRWEDPMTAQVLTGLPLLVLPIAYNLLYTLLARSFDYPDILRQPTGQVLARFTAGGIRLVLTWWGFGMSAVLLAPTVVLVSATGRRQPDRPGCPADSSSSTTLRPVPRLRRLTAAAGGQVQAPALARPSTQVRQETLASGPEPAQRPETSSYHAAIAS